MIPGPLPGWPCAAGIETIGVGIAIDVGALFPTAVTVNALGELRQALFTLVERLRLGVAA